ncbi:MAG: cysteine methyltransferase [Candidatus Zixiibacteriota bacterium]|nr:MAG: cysteine methyltransferase [candidate division Zixibacteria bacterium]
MKKSVYIHRFKTNLGWFRLASTEKGLAIINFTDPADFEMNIKKRFADFQVKAGGVMNRKAEKQIKSYLAGKLKKFSLKLDLEGTPFQRRVLRRVGSIPYGRTTTYGKIAVSIGNSGAARAVGSANAGNALPIVIPCHRVLAAGGPGGYAGGLKLKKYLLSLEKENS